MVSNETLLNVVQRLEAAIEKLNLTNSGNPVQIVTKAPVQEEPIRVFTEWSKKAKSNLMEMIDNALKSNFKENLEGLCILAIEAFCLHQDILEAQFNYKKPSADEVAKLQTLFMEIIKKVNSSVQDKRELSSHSEAIVYGVNSMLWITLSEGNVDVAQQYSDMIDSHRNKILLKKVEEESNWVKKWKEIFPELIKLIKMEYKVGLNWNYKTGNDFAEFLSNKVGENFKKFNEKKNFDFSTFQHKQIQPVHEKEVSSSSSTNQENLLNHPKNGNFNKVSLELLEKITLIEKENIPGIKELNQILSNGIKFLLHIINNSNKFKLPTNLDFLENYIKENFMEKLKTIDHNEIALFKEICINIFSSFYWITKRDQCYDIAEAYVGFVGTPANKIFVKKIQPQTDWVKAINAYLNEMKTLVKMNYKFGIDFNPKGSDLFEDLLKIDESVSNNTTESSCCSSLKWLSLTSDGLKDSSGSCGTSCICLEGLSGGTIKISSSTDSICLVKCSGLLIEANKEIKIGLESSSGNVFSLNGKEFKN